jgi:putative flippase GtrA
VRSSHGRRGGSDFAKAARIAEEKDTLFEKLKALFSNRIVRFGCVGLTVAVVFAALNALFNRAFGLGPQVCFLLAYPPALALHFLLNKLWTFGDRTSTTHHQLGEYFFSVLVTFLVQWPAFLLLQKFFGLRGWVSAFGANLLQMSVSFALLRWRVFHGKPRGEAGTFSNPWRRIAALLAVIGAVALVYWRWRQ